MINLTRLARSDFAKILSISVEDQNPEIIGACDVVKHMALVSYSRFAKSTSLYFSLNHVLSTSLIGLHLLNALRCRDGYVSPDQIKNLIGATLFCDVGIIQGVLREDDGDRLKIKADQPSSQITMHTDSSLWPYKAYRSVEFINDSAFIKQHIDVESVSRAIYFSDFMNLSHQTPSSESDDLAKYLRAIQIITLMSAQNYERRAVEFYLSAREANLLDREMFSDLSDFRRKWTQYFWEHLYPDVGEEILLLRETSHGRSIISQMYSHL
ncbi:MAG: hypothetical protein VW778_06825 [Betaproteobacteria bacterium]